MADNSKIEWTDATWNPIRARHRATGKVGWHCEHVSEGCRNCYAERINGRLGTGLDFKPGHRRDIDIYLDEQMLTQPLRWRQPRMIFPCSMTDLFADFVLNEWIDLMFAVMALCPQHTFQVPTKRPVRAREYMQQLHGMCRNISGVAVMVTEEHESTNSGGIKTTYPSKAARARDLVLDHIAAGFKNFWIGTSCEDQATADERIPHLLATPAAVRFVSLEPLLGPIDLTMLPTPGCDGRNALTGDFYGVEATDGCASDTMTVATTPRLGWVIVGGESGRGARPMHPDWARSLRDQCQAAEVPVFFKQWGEWAPSSALGGVDLPYRQPTAHAYMHRKVGVCSPVDADIFMNRVGKKRAGRVLDGRTWDEMPSMTRPRRQLMRAASLFSGIGCPEV